MTPGCICAWHEDAHGSPSPVWINSDGSPGDRVPADEARRPHSHGVCRPCAKRIMPDNMKTDSEMMR